MTSLEQAIIGNCTIGALIDTREPPSPGHAFLASTATRGSALSHATMTKSAALPWTRRVLPPEQHYLENTAILTTRFFDRQGGCVEVTDFARAFANTDGFSVR